MSRGNVAGVVAAKLDAASPLAASGALPENVNLCAEKQFSAEFFGVGAGGFSQTQSFCRSGDNPYVGRPRRRRMTDCADSFSGSWCDRCKTENELTKCAHE